MRRLFSLAALLAGVSILACDGLVTNTTANNGTGVGTGTGSADGGAGGPNGPIEPDVPLIPAGKVDLLLAVDNSASMSDKSKMLATSIETLIRQVARTGDVHVGVISSSLGNFGGDVCDPANARTNDRGHLRNVDETNAVVPEAAATGFLSYKTGDDVGVLAANTAKIVRGVGETGCGLEAQLESVYRFLIQPDPWDAIRLNGMNQAELGSTVDIEVLQQRADFLRPDSAVVVVMITDEDDSSVDPEAIRGQGWAFMAKSFPGSKVFRGSSNQGTTAPRGTSACDTNPGSLDCTSCGFQALCNPTDAACVKIRQDPNCTASGYQGQQGEGYNGYYSALDDSLNVRFHRMKERFGIDPQFPISRYVDGLTRFSVADRDHERKRMPLSESSSLPVQQYGQSDYKPTFNCTNPLFAERLPRAPGDELCNLKRGTRSRELVVFSVLGGVPENLANVETPNWTAILGASPETFNFEGIDPHMIQSVAPRAGLTAGEWNTDKSDLQYACTFPLATPRTCQPNDASCDCSPERGPNLPPLCENGTTQTRGKAYPTPRILRVARDLGTRGVIGSICAGSGYDATMTSLFNRLVPRLAL